MVVPAGIPDSAVVLVVLSVHVLVALFRIDPPVVTELMLPVSRTKRVIACAWAGRAPDSASIPINATNANARHPRFSRPRMSGRCDWRDEQHRTGGRPSRRPPLGLEADRDLLRVREGRALRGAEHEM